MELLTNQPIPPSYREQSKEMSKPMMTSLNKGWGSPGSRFVPGKNVPNGRLPRNWFADDEKYERSIRQQVQGGPLLNKEEAELKNNVDGQVNTLLRSSDTRRHYRSELLARQETQTSETQQRETQKSETQQRETQKSETQQRETQKSETQQRETQTSETQQRETQKSETQQRETQKSETQQRETQKSETQQRETQTSETQQRETQKSETQQRETQTSETQQRETQTSETQQRETQTSETQQQPETQQSKATSNENRKKQSNFLQNLNDIKEISLLVGDPKTTTLRINSKINSLLRHERSESELQILLQFTSSQGFTSSCKRVFNKIKNPTHRQYISLMSSSARNGDLARVQETWNLMKKRGVPSDIFTYNVVLNCFAIMKDEIRGAQLKEAMEADGMKPDAVTYNTLMSGCTSADSSMKYFREMQDAGFKPDKHTQRSLLVACVCDADVDAADLVLADMESRKVALDTASANKYLEVLEAAGKYDVLISQYQNFFYTMAIRQNLSTHEVYVFFISLSKHFSHQHGVLHATSDLTCLSLIIVFCIN